MAVRVAVIGTGVIGTDHATQLAHHVTGCEVTHVVDVDPGRARRLAEDLGVPHASSDGVSAIVESHVDAVVVASSAESHLELVLAAFDAGKPVLCEKPLAPTAADCRRIMQAESARGQRLLQVGFMRRYDAAYQAMKQHLDAGNIGDPLLLHMAHRNPQVPPSFTTAMMMTESAVHEIDVVRWLLADEIDAVSVVVPPRSSNASDHLLDPLLLLLRTRAGVVVDVELNVNCGYGYDIRTEVVGQHGALSLSRTRSGLDVVGATSPFPQDWRERFRLAYRTELQSWINDIEAGVLTGPTADDAIAAAEVADTAVRAIDTPGWLTVSGN